jgi:hypothetical protein
MNGLHMGMRRLQTEQLNNAGRLLLDHRDRRRIQPIPPVPVQAPDLGRELTIATPRMLSVMNAMTTTRRGS